MSNINQQLCQKQHIQNKYLSVNEKMTMLIFKKITRTLLLIETGY